ncbi:hypothetical protein ACWD4O_39085 [Streptomyces sp. NPDC002623]
MNPKTKKTALTLTGEALLIGVCLLAGLAGFYLLLDWSQWAAAVLAIATGVAADRVASPALTAMFITSTATDQQDKETVR